MCFCPKGIVKVFPTARCVTERPRHKYEPHSLEPSARKKSGINTEFSLLEATGPLSGGDKRFSTPAISKPAGAHLSFQVSMRSFIPQTLLRFALRELVRLHPAMGFESTDTRKHRTLACKVTTSHSVLRPAEARERREGGRGRGRDRGREEGREGENCKYSGVTFQLSGGSTAKLTN